MVGYQFKNNLKQIHLLKSMKVKNKIILAMDLTQQEAAMQVLTDITGEIDTIKIGYPLVLSEGLQSITTIKENFKYKVIADFKVADIPETNRKIADLTFSAGADAVIVHGFVGQDSVKACQQSAQEYGKDIFLLTEMSHPGAEQFIQNVSLDIARMGVNLGINNFVAPSTRLDRLEKIRKIVGEDSFIISPGVGVQGGNPAQTLEYADALIIGRSIYTAKYPQQALQSIIDSIKF